MGLGISSPNGTMRDGEAIIGYVPTAATAGSTAGTDTATNANDDDADADDNKGSVILKYNLQGPNNRGVSPMNDFQQTLLHTSIIHQQGNDDDGTMVMEFAKYLKEEVIIMRYIQIEKIHSCMQLVRVMNWDIMLERECLCWIFHDICILQEKRRIN